MKRIGFALIALSLVAGASATDKVSGTSKISSTAFKNLTGSATNKKISKDGLKVSWNSGKDQIYFTPTSFQASLDSPFKVGKLCWNNDSMILDLCGDFSVDLKVGLKFDNPGLGTQVFNVNLKHNSELLTLADKVTLPTTFESKKVVVDNIEYTIKLVGFNKASGSGSYSNGKWTMPECGSGCLDLYAEVDAKPVPEPATLAVLGLGAASFIRRRKKSN
jgi:hypothetical protein